MRRTVALALVGLLGSAGVVSAEGRGRGHDSNGNVILDGTETAVWWADADSFRPGSGPGARRMIRVVGYNALESYGPVQRWGKWTEAELLEVARLATRTAVAGRWRCESMGRRDSYGRSLARCPELARELVRRGLAMVFAVEGEPDRELLALQRQAQDRHWGMWAKGVPPVVMTSVHSVDEPAPRHVAPRGTAHNRVVDTRTGRTRLLAHQDKYAPCAPVCTVDGQSCMLYVPIHTIHARRHGKRPSCLDRIGPTGRSKPSLARPAAR